MRIVFIIMHISPTGRTCIKLVYPMRTQNAADSQKITFEDSLSVVF